MMSLAAAGLLGVLLRMNREHWVFHWRDRAQFECKDDKRQCERDVTYAVCSHTFLI